LKNKKEISRVFDSGEKIYSKNLLIRYAPNDAPGNLPLHVLMALPKKKLGAVGRNRMRRVCKSALFQALKNIIQLNVALPRVSYDLVIHARENFEIMPEPERVQEFEALMTRFFNAVEN